MTLVKMRSPGGKIADVPKEDVERRKWYGWKKVRKLRKKIGEKNDQRQGQSD